MRQYLLGRGYKVFTSPAMAGYGPVMDTAGDDAGPFGQCPNALPGYMTVDSTGDIQLAGVHLANFVIYLGRKYGVKQVDFVAHSMGGLYSRSAIQYLRQTGSKIKARSLTTLGTPWEGAALASSIDPNDRYSGCDGQEICKILLDVFSAKAPVIATELSRTQMARLNTYNSGTLDNVPVSLIAGNAYTKAGGNPRIWPNDGIVDVQSGLAQNLPDSVIKNRRCYILNNGTHSLWISQRTGRPDSDAITWNGTVGDWVAQSIREANLASHRTNREGCPMPG